jgi:hypothetical protein
LVQSYVESASDCVFSTVLVSSQEDRESLGTARRVRFSKHTYDLWVRKPFWNLFTIAKTVAKLSSWDIEGSNTSRNLVLGTILVTVWQVCHHLKWNNFDAKLVLVLLYGVLCIIWTVKFLSFTVLARSCVVTTHDEMSCSIVLADDSMPDSFAGSTHTHGQRKKTKDCHTVGISWEEGLVNTDTGEMVDVTRFRQTNNWVDKNIRLASTSGADSQLPMGSMHGVSGLEGNDLGPAELVKVKAKFCRCIC